MSARRLTMAEATAIADGFRAKENLDVEERCEGIERLYLGGDTEGT